MIDWLNLLAGFALGLLTSYGFLRVERRHQRKQARLQALSEWVPVAGKISQLVHAPDTTWETLRDEVASHPIDQWRAALGPDDFVALERLEMAFMFNYSTGGEPALLAERQDAAAAFFNIFQHRNSERYAAVLAGEERQKVRHAFWRHPVRTIRSERLARREGRTL
jgi:hypothetical protein